MIKQLKIFMFGIFVLLFLFTVRNFVYAQASYEPEAVDWEERYVQKLNDIHSPEEDLSSDQLLCFNDVYAKDGLAEAEGALENKYIPECYRKTGWKSTKATLGCVYSQPDFLELAKRRVWNAINICKKKVKKTAPFPTEVEKAPLSKEEQYNECVNTCFLNKVLSMCSDNNSMSSQCSFDLVVARRDCLRSCKPPVQFQTPKRSNQGKIITQQDYGDQEAITLNGLPIAHNASSNTPIANYPQVINKIDFDLAKTSKPQKISEKNLEVWIADMKGDVQVSVVTGSATPQWIAAKTGDILSEGTRIFVAKDASLLIGTDVGVLKISGLSNLTITKATVIDGKRITLYIDLSVGTIEADIDKGQYELDMQINTLSSLAKVTGTHFFVVFDDEKMRVEIGVFGGEVEVESLVTGQKLALVPQSSGKFRMAFVPLEVPIPTTTQEPASTSNQEAPATQTNGNGVLPILMLVSAIGIGLFLLHKKGKLLPLYKGYKEKISGAIKKTEKDKKQPPSA